MSKNLTRYLISTALVSLTFLIYAIYVTTLNGQDDSSFIKTKGILMLALFPYLIGAYINKNGYWERDNTDSREIVYVNYKNKYRWARKLRRLAISGVFIAAVFFAYQYDGLNMVKNMFLLMIGIAWGALVTRAWFVYRQEEENKDKRNAN